MPCYNLRRLSVVSPAYPRTAFFVRYLLKGGGEGCDLNAIVPVGMTLQGQQLAKRVHNHVQFRALFAFGSMTSGELFALQPRTPQLTLLACRPFACFMFTPKPTGSPSKCRPRTVSPLKGLIGPLLQLAEPAPADLHSMLAPSPLPSRETVNHNPRSASSFMIYSSVDSLNAPSKHGTKHHMLYVIDVWSG